MYCMYVLKPIACGVLTQETKDFPPTIKGFRDGLSYSKKAKKQGETPLPSLSPIPLKKNVEFRNGMGPRLGNGISPCFFTFYSRGGV